MTLKIKNMKIEDAIKHLTNLSNSGYSSYEIKVRNACGYYTSLSGFNINVDDETINLY